MSKVAEVAARLEAESVEIVGPGGETTAPDPPDTLEDETAPGADSGGAEPAATSARTSPPAGADPKVPVAPDAKKAPDDDRTAAKFAALSRQKQENLRLIDAAEQRSRALAEKEAAIAAREAEIAGALESPDRVFELLQKKLGVGSLEDLQKYAAKAWSAPKREVPPDQRPLTAAEVQRMFEERDTQARMSAVKSQVESDFLKLTDDDAKYEAAALLYSAAERVAHGNRIANELTKLGEPWTLADIADAVDELARQDSRYAKLQARTGLASASKDASKASQQGKTAPRIPTADDAGERATPQSGAAKLSRKERLERLRARMG